MLKTKIFSLLIFLTVISCSEKKIEDWRQFYIKQEKSRIVTIQKHFEYNLSGYTLTSTDSSFATFNAKKQMLGTNNTHFYKYNDDGKIIEEKYCTRTCENPRKVIYYYDSLKRLEKTKIVDLKKYERISALYFYNDANLLIKKVTGVTSTKTTEKYSYDKFNRLSTTKKHEFNNNVNKWFTTLDSLFYDSKDNVIQKKRYHVGEDLVTISKFRYDNKMRMTQIDTTITKLKGYLPTAETSYHAYYFRIDFKYNGDKKIIEEITTQPDYKTPVFKVIYDYK